MTDTTIVLLTGLIGVVLGTALFGAALGGAWVLGARFGGRRSASRPFNGELSTQEQTIQLAEVVRTLHSMSLELERVSDAQRFTAQALTQLQVTQLGGSSQLPANPDRIVTPH